MKTYLVTGAAGFIGFHVSRALLERGDRVLANAEEVIRNVLQDKDKAIEKYLTGEEDLAIFVTLLEINSKIEKIIQQILNAQKDKYLHMTTHQEASEKGEEAEEKNEPAHEDDEDDDDYESEEGVY